MRFTSTIARNRPSRRTFMPANRFLPLSFCILAGMIPFTAIAQELDCSVTVNQQQITGSGFEYVSELKGQLETYLNETQWSDRTYLEHERIKCSIQILLTSASSDFTYSARFVANVRRPIYNTMQQSTILLINDEEWQFSYPRGTSFIRDDLQFDGLISLIDFYVYIMLGYDADTFSELGGTAWYNKAKSLQELGETSGSPGWARAVGAQRNRFGLVSDLTNSAYDDLRRAVYRYHRLGLDLFVDNPQTARTQALNALKQIQTSQRMAANPYLYDVFFGTKAQEAANLFAEAPISVRTEAAILLKEINPGNSTIYDRLLE